MKSTVSRLILINLILISTFTALHSQVIYFSGKNKLTNEPVQLDSVKIINNTLQRDTTIIGDSIDLSVLTAYKEIDNSYNSDFFVENISDLGSDARTFRVKANIDINLSVNVYNLVGSSVLSQRNILTQGNHYIKLNEILMPGIYFASFSDGKTTQTIKILKTEELFSNFSSINQNPQEKNVVLVNDEYTFIGYAKGYFRDTLIDNNLDNIINYIFELEAVSNWNVNNCKINIKIPAIIYTHHKKGRGPYNEDWERYDTTYFQFKIEYRDSVLDFHRTCDTTNVRDTIIINKCTYVGYGIDSKIRIVIDTAKNVMKSINYYYYEETPANMYKEKPYVKKEISIIIDTLACTLLRNDHIKGSIYKSYLHLWTIKYSEFDNYSIGGNDDFYDIKLSKILPADDDTFIDIELTK